MTAWGSMSPTEGGTVDALIAAGNNGLLITVLVVLAIVACIVFIARR